MNSKTIHIIHGPNLNRLGKREVAMYGTLTLAELDDGLKALGSELGVAIATSQHSSEGGYVDAIHAAFDEGAAGLVLNPGAYTHTSIAIRDAILSVGLPAVEIHMTNVHARESFRHTSTIADVVVGRIMGFGADSYALGLRAIIAKLDGA